MKTFNKKTIAQKGGLMIEALAMLGLIAVVTPTMYKKSAERTLEVEDINTASTVRSVMNAAESYVAANYIQLMNEIADGGNKTITAANLQGYLPYQMSLANALYDYNAPTVKIMRSGSGLTVFALFPAKGAGDAGLGQERTARIASMIGANGGYVTGTKTARGVGGIWSLNSTQYDKVGLPAANAYSLLVASSNVVNGTSAAGAIENTKYLQRTPENDEKWRNTLRTDIYMGGDTGHDPDSANTDKHSIRNINSLIVGTDTDPTGGNNGLYIDPNGANPNAYIGGTITAAGEQFFVDPDNLEFGKRSGGGYNFVVTKNGDVTTYGNVEMGKEASAVKFGQLGDPRKVNAGATDWLFNGTITSSNAEVTMLSPNMFHISTDGTALKDRDNVGYSTHMLLEKNGDRGVSANNGQNSAGNTIWSSTMYGTKPRFPVVVGSNMLVEGLLTGGQVDANYMRATNFSAGSEKIDDTYKWFYVDNNGVRMQDPAGRPDVTNTQVVVNQNGIGMRTGDSETTGRKDAYLKLSKYANDDGDANRRNQGYISGKAYRIVLETLDSTNGAIVLKNANVAMRMKDKDIQIGNANTFSGSSLTNTDDYRVLTGKGGNIDLVQTDLKIVNSDNYNIFTVRGRTGVGATPTTESSYGTNYNDTSDAYNIIGRGNIAFRSISNRKATGATANTETSTTYLAMGPNDGTAAVNIADRSAASYTGVSTTEASRQRLVFIDLSSKDSDAYVNPSTNKIISDADPTGTNKETYTMQNGTVYIRKGLVDVTQDKSETNKTANSGTGIIRASRLVANNADSTGNMVKVPQLVTDKWYKEYNGATDTTGRYDTYMVNPAYTSVMKDIKLTTRGGARLSDVLPDFITKSIYVATNTYNDSFDGNLVNMVFKLASTSGSTTDFKIVNEPESSDATDWASPYLGLAPAPQCPPGYGRVITVNPISFQMAQAGQLSYSDSAGVGGLKSHGNIKGSYFVDERKMAGNLKPVEETTVATQTTAMKKMTPDYLQITETMNYTTPEDNGAGDDPEGSVGQTTHYVLAAPDANALKPLVFQQSTWLKALAVPVYDSIDMNYDGMNDPEILTQANGKYARGWAIMMGFLYPHDVYGTIICGVKSGGSYTAPSICNNNAHKLSPTRDIYWNIFPVKKNTMEAYVTTYCYFDRMNMFSMYKDGYSNHVDSYNILNNVPTSYSRAFDGTTQYRNSLNDPTMKYNEVW